MLERLNLGLEKFMPLLTPSGVILGVWLGEKLTPYLFLSPWLFAFMTFTGSLNSRVRQIAQVLTQPFPIIVTLTILHIIMPLMAWGFGHIFYADQPYTATGLILAMAIPTGISSLTWVTMARGHTALTLCIIVTDTLLSPFVVPWTISALVGARVSVEPIQMMIGLLLMIVLPALAGIWLNARTKGQMAITWSPRFSPFSKLAIGLVVMLNASMVAPYLIKIDTELVTLAVCALILISVGYIFGWLTSISMKWSKDKTIAVTLNSGMRNISAGSVLAITYFPPLVAVPIICCILFQQTLAALFSRLLNR